MKKNKLFINGMRDGFPIGLGYFAVSFSLGIAAYNAGLNWLQGTVMSLLNNASAGEYAGIAAIRANAPYVEIALLILIANARYLLMSTALSQKLSPSLSIGHRMAIGFDITDEIFGLAIAQETPVNPIYLYGSFLTTIPMWALGTALGVIAGNILPIKLVYGLSATIYGMFMAVVIPPSRKSKTILYIVLFSFVLSTAVSMIPFFKAISESFRIIVLTLVISFGAALIAPHKEEEKNAE